MQGIPIKFRAKRVKDNKFVYGYYVVSSPMSSFPAIVDYDNNYNAVYIDSVAQLLGYDKNGVEVYEDDTLYYKSDDKKILFKAEMCAALTEIKRHSPDYIFKNGDFKAFIKGGSDE